MYGAEQTEPRPGQQFGWSALQTRSPSLGGWSIIPDAFVVEILSRAGYDWICLDCQHGLLDRGASLAMMRALDIVGVPALVRVGWNDPREIMHALDGGAAGVIVPMINSADEARAAVEASKFPPLGARSWGPVRASLVRSNFTPATANDRTLCLVMVETPEAVANIDHILDVDGVDGVYIGPSDLSLSTHGFIDRPGMNPTDAAAIQRVVDACRSRGLHCGIPCADAPDVQRRTLQGFTLLSLGTDLSLLSTSATQGVAEITELDPFGRRQ